MLAHIWSDIWFRTMHDGGYALLLGVGLFFTVGAFSREARDCRGALLAMAGGFIAGWFVLGLSYSTTFYAATS